MEVLLFSIYIVLAASAIPIGLLLCRQRLWARMLPFTVFYVFAYVTLILGSVYVFFGATRLGPSSGLFSWQYVLLLCIVVLLVYATLLSTFPMRRKLHGVQYPVPRSVCIDLGLFSLLVWALALAIIGHYVYRFGLPLLFTVHNSVPGDLLELRTVQTVHVPWHRYYYGFHWLPTLATVLLFFRWIGGENGHGRLLFFFSLAGASVLSVSFFRKTYAVELIMVLSFAYIMLSWHRIRLSSIASLAVASLSVAWLLYVPYFHDRSVAYFFTTIPEGLFRRIVTAYSESSAAVFAMIDDSSDFFMGRTFSNPGGIFPYEPTNLPGLMYGFFYPDVTSGGNKPVGALAEAYANFGWIGVFGFALAIFLIITGVQFLYLVAQKNVVIASLTCMLLIEVYRIHQNSLVSSILSPMLLIMVFLVVSSWVAIRAFVRLEPNRKTAL